MDVMDQLPIRLVVKAPNQQIDDQIIDCAITWTVKKLKTYLSEVYPSNPRAEDQKLIYSGQLLPDNLMLKDVLRQYDSEVVHTVHLVCMPPKDKNNTNVPSLSSPPTASSIFERSASSHGSSEVPVNEGLRQRNVQPRPEENPSVQNLQLPHSINPNIPHSPEVIAQQMAWFNMYNNYMNYYMQQYQGVYPGVNSVPQQQPTVDPQGVAAAAADQANQQQQRQANEIRRLNAQGAPADDEEDDLGGRRDWLDWVYVFSRLSVLFAIVYFYSSFNRFVMVVAFAVFIYIYQTRGFWRRERIQRINNRERNERAQDEQEQNQNRNAEERDMEQINRETRELEETMDRDAEANTQQTFSFFHIAWTFVASFFSSLLPQQPGAVIN